jgi:hypothetical protein
VGFLNPGWLNNQKAGALSREKSLLERYAPAGQSGGREPFKRT